MFFILLAITIALPYNAESTICRCFSTGSDYTLNQYLQGESYNVAPFTGTCWGNMTCWAPSNAGCYAVQKAGQMYAFCGQSVWPGGLTYFHTIHSELTELETCYNIKDSDNSLCQCDYGSYCNAPLMMMKRMLNSSSKLSLSGILLLVSVASLMYWCTQ